MAPFNKDHQIFIFLSIPDSTSGQSWLRNLQNRLADNASVTGFNERFSRVRRAAGQDPEALFSVWCNASFTAPGMRILAREAMEALEARPDLDDGIKHWLIGAADEAVAAAVGDASPDGSASLNAPDGWVFGNLRSTVHAVVCIAADRVTDLAGEVARHRKLAAEHGLTVVFEQDGDVLPGQAAGHEHFGFKDGISQPGVRGYDFPDSKNEQVAGKPGTDLIAAGTFLLGYPRDHEASIPAPEWMFDGSFLVTRRLAQDVPGFWAGVEKQHVAITGPDAIDAVPTADALGAKMVGRWRSGTPTAHRSQSDNRAAQNPNLDNDFDFAEDPDGESTPKCAHIRKVYPRSGAEPNTSEEDTMAHRILRRGIPFGPPFQPTAGRGEGVDAERGLIFQSYQASLEGGFVFIQRDWVNKATFPDDGVGNDPVIGLLSDVTVPIKDQPAQKLTFDQFVTTQGTLFSFTPRLSVVDRIAHGQPLPFRTGAKD